MKIKRQDTDGVKPLLGTGELGYDNYPAGGDVGRVYVGTGSANIAQAKKSEVDAAVATTNAHIGRVDNPHSVTKAQVGLSNVDNTSDLNKPIGTATQSALDLKANQATTYTKTEVDTALDSKVDDTEIASVNLLRADKFLAAQNIANMAYTDGNLTKIQYNNATNVDYEVYGYVSGNLSTIQHYVGSVLKGTTTLSYTSGNLVSAIFIGV